MRVRKDVSLKGKSTFTLPARAQYWVEISSVEDLLRFKKNKRLSSLPCFILGEGSNTVVVRDFDGVILHPCIKGREILRETEAEVVVRLGAGENWHRFVRWAMEQDFGGVELLALIPGTVGAAPVQNIAAYGGEFADVFEYLEAVKLGTGERRVFLKRECQLGYRRSIFKEELKNQYLITAVVLRLQKRSRRLTRSSLTARGVHTLVLSELDKLGKRESYTGKDLYRAVVEVRKQRLVNCWEGPTVGSVFVNPVVSEKKAGWLRRKDPELPLYPFGDGRVKIPAARLIENLGWRGKWVGNVRMSTKHALVMTHNGKATGEEVLRLIRLIRESVWEEYRLRLELEINLL